MKYEREQNDADCITYRKMIILTINKINNTKLLKRIYELAEYLYLYENME